MSDATPPDLPGGYKERMDALVLDIMPIAEQPACGINDGIQGFATSRGLGEKQTSMSAEITCDGCGKKAPMIEANHNFHKPGHWYQRSDKDGIQVACSRKCINDVADKSKKTSLVLPI